MTSLTRIPDPSGVGWQQVPSDDPRAIRYLRDVSEARVANAQAAQADLREQASRLSSGPRPWAKRA